MKDMNNNMSTSYVQSGHTIYGCILCAITSFFVAIICCQKNENFSKSTSFQFFCNSLFMKIDDMIDPLSPKIDAALGYFLSFLIIGPFSSETV